MLLHGGLNGTLAPNAEYIFRAGDANGHSIGASWVWAAKNNDSVRISIEVPSTGLHTVNLWPREEGIIVDKVLLTTEAGITYTVEVSETLQPESWETGTVHIEQVGTPVSNGDGTETVTVRLRTAITAADRNFIRLKASTNP